MFYILTQYQVVTSVLNIIFWCSWLIVSEGTILLKISGGSCPCMGVAKVGGKVDVHRWGDQCPFQCVLLAFSSWDFFPLIAGGFLVRKVVSYTAVCCSGVFAFIMFARVKHTCTQTPGGGGPGPGPKKKRNSISPPPKNYNRQIWIQVNFIFSSHRIEIKITLGMQIWIEILLLWFFLVGWGMVLIFLELKW